MKITEIKVGMKMTKNYNSYEATINALTEDKDASLEDCFSSLRGMVLTEVGRGLEAISHQKETNSQEKQGKANEFLKDVNFLGQPSEVSKCDRTEHECYKMSNVKRKKAE